MLALLPAAVRCSWLCAQGLEMWVGASSWIGYKGFLEQDIAEGRTSIEMRGSFVGPTTDRYHFELNVTSRVSPVPTAVFHFEDDEFGPFSGSRSIHNVPIRRDFRYPMSLRTNGSFRMVTLTIAAAIEGETPEILAGDAISACDVVGCRNTNVPRDPYSCVPPSPVPSGTPSPTRSQSMSLPVTRTRLQSRTQSRTRSQSRLPPVDCMRHLPDLVAMGMCCGANRDDGDCPRLAHECGQVALGLVNSSFGSKEDTERACMAFCANVSLADEPLWCAAKQTQTGKPPQAAKGLSVGFVAGISIAVIVVVAGIVIIAVACLMRRKQMLDAVYLAEMQEPYGD